jgi:hypothetical protein
MQRGMTEKGRKRLQRQRERSRRDLGQRLAEKAKEEGPDSIWAEMLEEYNERHNNKEN